MRDVLPCLASHDATDVRLGDVIALTYRILNVPSAAPHSDLFHAIIAQLCIPIGDTWRWSTPVFAVAIGHVVGMRSEEEVAGPHAFRVVAMVQNKKTAWH